MKYVYGEFEGEEWRGPDSLFGYEQVMEFVLAYGEEALEAMAKMDPAEGVAFYCASDDLASCVMESYLSGKKSKTYIA